MTDVTVLGAGFMGAAIARVLMERGRTVTVWNRTPAKTERLREAGATVAEGFTDALTLSPVTISALSDYAALVERLEPVASLEGVDLVNLTTGQPHEADELEALVTARGGRLLDGAIICYPSHIGTEKGVVKFSGPNELWERHHELLELLGTGTDHLGEPVRLANVLDAAQLGFYIPAIGAAMEAAAYAEREGLGFADLRPVLVHGLNVMTGFLAKREDMIAKNDFAAEDSPAEVYLAAMRGVVEAMDRADMEPLLGRAVIRHLEEVQAAGRLDGDFAEIYRSLRESAGEQE
ncbi:NAD(P)-dependent oxidoreductase [Actinomadura spongiicola]|uniref:NAD(P)-dependent oxidoreductase n=1 Tax=Actinomadura spongiicola TaxID=2303421 RepID=A0A372GPX7_9ACTN|nr:FAD-dependent oxidoreductase [Actinomadura spongiicola]RFS87375.1 NAD(P)-dependent oxidoreductase [Actinomadura spongiicola]